MTLREQRVDFTKRFYNWLHWWYTEFNISHPDTQIAFDECTVHSPRKIWDNGKKVLRADAVHKVMSRHHDGCAIDILLYVKIAGKWIYVSNGDHPYWLEMGKKATDFGLINGASWHDINHFSTQSPDGRK